MGFWTSPSTKDTNGWVFNTNLMQRTGVGSSIGLYWNEDNSVFSGNKTYLIKTKVENITLLSENELVVNTIWGHVLRNPSISGYIPSDGYLTYYSSPSSFIENKISHFYTASDTFNSTKGIIETSVTELDWNIIGFSWISNNSVNLGFNTHGSGWNFINNSYVWHFRGLSVIEPATLVNNVLVISNKYIYINSLYKYISAQRFNLEFKYSILNVDIEIYTSRTPPYNGTDPLEFDNYLKSANKILTIPFIPPISETMKQEGTKLLVSLTGGQYVLIIGKNSLDTLDGFIDIDGLKISSDYHPGNNQLYTPNINYEIQIEGATFSAIVGDREGEFLEDNIELSSINSRIGNGTFTFGTWENGVWNNGWRKDDYIKELFDIEYNIKIYSDFKWQIKIVGLYEDINIFKKGDLVSIGNVVAIDINEERKQLIDYYKIVDICVDCDPLKKGDYKLSFIIVEIETTFPIRRIEKDSINHRIKITKNIWLSGAFFNGYFTGIWNYGLFKGYPLITEMYDTHWKEGIFEGGHFKSTYINEKNEYSETFFNDTKLGLKMANRHKLKVGDTIIIDKSDKTTNSAYDGETNIIRVIDEYNIVTDVDFIIKEEVGKGGGFFYNYISDSLIQNFNLKSENISKITSNTTLDSTSVFSYNSWIDTNYDNTVAVNVGKNQNLLDGVSKKSYAENNLYGYKTNDVLSSISEFRNSYSLDKLKYKLGTKYKVYKNYIGDAGLFQEYFDTSNDIENFISQGWTFSSMTFSSEDSPYIRYQRTLDEGIENIVGKELKISASFSGGVLNTVNSNKIIIDNREIIDIEKNRYTKIEFDLMSKSSELNEYILDDFSEPILHFNNINYITRENNKVINTALPIHKNVNLLETNNITKSEYFYNKKNLSLYLKGNGENGEGISTVTIKNLKFLETDMIPFFKYFTDDSINKSIQIPYQGIAPAIDYDNVNFSFLDNIKIGLDSFDITSSYDLVSGIGTSVSSGITIVTNPNTTPPSTGNLLPPTKVKVESTLPTLIITANYNSSNANICVNAILSVGVSQAIGIGIKISFIKIDPIGGIGIPENLQFDLTIGANNTFVQLCRSIGISENNIVIQPPCLIYITPNNLITTNILMCSPE